MRKLQFLFLCFMAAACASPPEPVVVAPLEFGGAPITLDVARIEIQDEYEPRFGPPNVEHLFPTTPKNGMKKLIKSRLKAGGSGGVARAIIKRAEVKESYAGGDEGLFGDGGMNRYDGVLELEVSVYREGGLMSDARINVKASRSRTLKKRASVDEQQAFFQKMNQDMLSDLGKELEAKAVQYLR